MPAGSTVRRTTEAAAYGGMFLFGMVMALLGAVLPLVSSRLGLDLGVTGNLFLAMNAAMLLASLVLGPVLDRFGFRAILSAGPLLIAVALVLAAQAPRAGVLAFALALLGFGGSAVNNATNTLVSDLHEEPREKGAALNRLGTFFGFGALVLPFLIASMVEALGLARILFGAAAFSVLLALLTAPLTFPPPKQAGGFGLAEAAQALRHPIVPVLAALLFFQSGNEFLLSGYLTTYLTRETGATVEAASYVLAAYWAATIVARALLGRILVRIPGARLVPLMALLAAACVALAAIAPTFALAAAALLAASLTLAGIFPTVLGLAGAQFPSRSGTVFGVLFTVGLCGGMTLPWVAGHLAAATGLRAVLVLAASAFVAVALLAWRASRLATTAGH